jgi:serine/threonine protein kinase
LLYIAPEQIQGKPTDERTDMFALGAILYEMLTGRKAFEADNPASVIAAVLERDLQQVSLARQDVSPAIDRVIGRCLAKSPDARWQSAADLASELRWLRDAGAAPVRPPAVRSRGVGGYRYRSGAENAQGNWPLQDPVAARRLVPSAAAARRIASEPGRDVRPRSPQPAKGWNPPGTTTRAIRGHLFGLERDASDKSTLLAFLRSL